MSSTGPADDPRPTEPTLVEHAAPTVDRQTRRKVITASFIGNFVEWFDYAMYGYLAAVIAVVFFPDSEPRTALISTFAIFAVSFIVRPLGGFFWGYVGDKVGRRTALGWSILIMSAATFAIGLTPGFLTIGLAAPILLLLFRLIQGFSASGEYAGAASFLVEYAPEGKRGIYAAVVPASTAAGLLFGSIFATVLTWALTTDQIETWGWRIPFLLAGPLGFIGHYIRTRLEDTPIFKELEKLEDVEQTTPIRTLFVEHWRALLLAFGAVLLNASGFYVILSYMPTYLAQEIGLDPTLSYLATTFALVTYIGFIFLTGMLSDRVGRRTVLISAAVAAIILTVPAFALLSLDNFLIIVMVQIMLGAALTLNDGTLPSFLSEIFPTDVRYSGFAVSFNTANALFGGTAPLIATFLIGVTGTTLAPAFYLVAAAFVSLIAVWLAKETSREPLKRTW